MSLAKLTLGLVGKPCSGKDTVAAYLTERYGFAHVSTGDLVRFYIAEHNLGEPDRVLARNVANRMREENGADYLVRLALANETPLLVVSGIRAIAEAEAVQEVGKIVCVNASVELRFERMQGRGRASDNITLAQFREQEAAEDANSSESAQNVLQVMALADHSVDNQGDLEHLQAQIDVLLASFSEELAIYYA